MTQLSSCYFCGAALDAPVAAYPIVPEAAADGDQRTVTLCPSCRRKLASVLNVAVDAVADADSIEPALDADDAESVLGSAEPAASRADQQRDTDTESADEGSDVEPADDAESLADESTTTGEPDAEAAPTTETSSETRSDTEGDASAEEPSQGETGTVTEEGSETDGDGEALEGEGDGSAPTGDVDPEPEGGGDTPDEPAPAEQSPLSTPTARKVVRLLQNREFPVDREEFEIVASNAYEIPGQDCAAVVDALVSDGYVDERDGQLVRPED